MGSQILGVGLAGKSLTDLERRFLRETPPYAVVLFGRNIESPRQLRELVREVKSLAPIPPLFMIDQEGGRVDRLRQLIPGIPSAETFGEGERSEEMAEWQGRVIGASLRYFDIEINLAPVVDIRGATSPKGLERRTFGNDVETVLTLAGAFIRGQHSTGVAACLKHYPGIGLGSADPHYGATIIDISLEELVARDLVPFVRLGELARAVMIGHGTYPQIDEHPATLSHRITTDLLRTTGGFRGVTISDDMEMHSVSDLGSYEDICEQALLAGNDIVLFCSHIERMADVGRFINDRIAQSPEVARRYGESRRHAEEYRVHCLRLRAASEPLASFDALIDEAQRFCDAFAATRPPHDVYIPESERRKYGRSPGKGKTGREEWT